MTGFMHVYAGNGKGKTTAALGLSLRALGRDFTVYFIQFMKGDPEYGEARMADKLAGFHFYQFGTTKFVDRNDPDTIDIQMARQGLSHAHQVMMALPENGKRVVMVLDELNVALDFNLVELEEVLKLISGKPEEMELVITGRDPHPKVLELADYFTEMKEHKHPYTKGIMAREGIEH